MTPAQFTTHLERLTSKINATVRRVLPLRMGQAAQHEFYRNFSREGFFDTKWKPAQRRLQPRRTRDRLPTLTQSGDLGRSIQFHVSGLSVRVFSESPYAAAHNEGGTLVQTVAAHSRISSRGRVYQVREHSRTVLLPQRRFIGHHAQLERELTSIIDRTMQQALPR